uniref:Uncharacterized protein n=1 Tax=Lactuca sativa TaxID=4236 RepID=A0A9R1W309_LACSA|nr:hypothetical protein LSAT_V11C300153570 [Lactuca sativa]
MPFVDQVDMPYFTFSTINLIRWLSHNWFYVSDLSEYAYQDVESMDASVAHEWRFHLYMTYITENIIDMGFPVMEFVIIRLNDISLIYNLLMTR